jgi:hypothetical protein
MFFCVVCCAGSGLGEGLITGSEGLHRVCGVYVCGVSVCVLSVCVWWDVCVCVCVFCVCVCV